MSTAMIDQTEKNTAFVDHLKPEYVTVLGSAEYLHVTPAAIWRYLTDKKLTRYKSLGRTLIKISELRALVRRVS
jgi:hypothetical protein